MKSCAFTDDRSLCNGSLIDHGGELFPFEYDRFAPEGVAIIVFVRGNQDGSETVLGFTRKSIFSLVRDYAIWFEIDGR